jgi:hypothetical protein
VKIFDAINEFINNHGINTTSFKTIELEDYYNDYYKYFSYLQSETYEKVLLIAINYLIKSSVEGDSFYVSMKNKAALIEAINYRHNVISNYTDQNKIIKINRLPTYEYKIYCEINESKSLVFSSPPKDRTAIMISDCYEDLIIFSDKMIENHSNFYALAAIPSHQYHDKIVYYLNSNSPYFVTTWRTTESKGEEYLVIGWQKGDKPYEV